MISIEINSNPFTQSETLPIFTIMITTIWLIITLTSLYTYGWRKTFRYLVPIMIASLFLEASAIANGRYHYPDYLIYINLLGANVPFIILLGWSVNLFIFTKLSEYTITLIYNKINHIHTLLVASYTGVIGVCIDLLEDPIAHHNKWWIWTGEPLNMNIYGVPLSNFLDWFLILFFMSLTTLLIDQAKISENKKLILSIISVSYTGAIIFISHYLLVELLSL
ncbi:MAG: carotenoid biosynthesis protein [Candidatus Thermoplasmatota archaeon]